ncbi:hypothetical protein AVEN_212178-1, partial [Araneus ventricosus]
GVSAAEFSDAYNVHMAKNHEIEDEVENPDYINFGKRGHLVL